MITDLIPKEFLKNTENSLKLDFKPKIYFNDENNAVLGSYNLFNCLNVFNKESFDVISLCLDSLEYDDKLLYNLKCITNQIKHIAKKDATILLTCKEPFSSIWTSEFYKYLKLNYVWTIPRNDLKSFGRGANKFPVNDFLVTSKVFGLGTTKTFGEKSSKPFFNYYKRVETESDHERCYTVKKLYPEYGDYYERIYKFLADSFIREGHSVLEICTQDNRIYEKNMRTKHYIKVTNNITKKEL